MKMVREKCILQRYCSLTQRGCESDAKNPIYIYENDLDNFNLVKPSFKSSVTMSIESCSRIGFVDNPGWLHVLVVAQAN